MLKRFAEVMVVLMVLKTCNGLLLGDLEYVNCSAVVSQKSGRGDGLSHGGCPLWFTNETGECQPGPKLGRITTRFTDSANYPAGVLLYNRG